MIKYLRTLFGLCDHKWEIINKISIFANNYDSMPYATKYVLQCEHCGNLKEKRV